MAQAAMQRRSRGATSWAQLRHFLPLLAAAAIGLGASIAGWYAVSLRDDQLAALDFHARAKSRASIIQNGINEYAGKIEAVRSFFVSSREVDRREFTFFTDQLARNRAAILRLSWIPRIARNERLAHEQEGVRQGLEAYRIHELYPGRASAQREERDEYFPVFYATGVGAVSDIYGFDVGSERMRRRTLERARDTGEMAVAQNVTLNTAVGDRQGVFILLPVYRQGAPHDTLEDRRQNLVGFVNGVFETRVMIDTILAATATPGGMDVYLFAQGAAGEGALLSYSHRAHARSVPINAQARATLALGLHWSSEITLGDGRWTYLATPTPGGPLIATHGRAWSLLIAGMLFTGLIVAYMWASVGHARRLQAANKSLERSLGERETQNARFDAALSNMSEGLCMFDGQQRLLLSNARYARMYGLLPDQLKPGMTRSEVFAMRSAHGGRAGEISQEYARKMRSMVARNEPASLLQELNDGRVIALKFQPLPGGGWVSTHEDISERRRIEARMAYMARHDALTGLANGVRLKECLADAISQASPQDGVAVLSLDLGRFKEVNDTLGHAVGDGLLKSVAARLRSCIGETDTVARVGGDEFAVVQIGANQPVDATALATRLIESIGAPHIVEGQEVEVSTSIGIAVLSIDGANPDELLRNANLALHRAKMEGRGTHRFFEKGMDERMLARRELEHDLRRALINGEFEVHYQPLIDLQSGAVTCFEALLRWNHPERGMVSPANFVPLAEEIGLIVPIGAWVLHQACAEAVNWPQPIKVAVNLSSAQFKGENLLATVSSALDASGLAACRLELEITESIMLMDSVRTVAMLCELRNLGTGISMDDFGTGYSSLSYLQSFPFDKIKIDQSFVRNINESHQSLAIVQAVAGLGVSLRMATIAEGVETKEQLDRVRALGCTEAQGYYFSRPRPACEVAALLVSMGQRSDRAA
jgi:diguanylate cyclase (GGDEF)-like protein